MDPVKTHPAAAILPPEVLALPSVEIPVAGVTGYSLQNDSRQVVFFIFEEGVSVPDHAHCEQRGMVISGEMVLEIEGEKHPHWQIYRASILAAIPDSGGIEQDSCGWDRIWICLTQLCYPESL